MFKDLFKCYILIITGYGTLSNNNFLLFDNRPGIPERELILLNEERFYEEVEDTLPISMCPFGFVATGVTLYFTEKEIVDVKLHCNDQHSKSAQSYVSIGAVDLVT